MSQRLLTLPLSVGIHLLSLVPCSASQCLEAGGVFLSPICAEPSTEGLLAPSEVTRGDSSSPELSQPQDATTLREAGGCI